MPFQILCLTVVFAATGPATRPASRPATTRSTPYRLEANEKIMLSQRVLGLLQRKEFAELEKLGDDLLKGARFRDGEWQLEVYYNALAGKVRGYRVPTANHVQSLKAWRQARRQSAHPLLALAASYVDWAWELRGTDYAADTSEDQSDLMLDRLQTARDYTEKAAKLSPHNPEIYVMRLRIAMGSGNLDEVRADFEAGVKASPGYTGLYRAMAYMLLPRWYGDTEDAAAFAVATANRTRGSEGEAMYAHIASFVSGMEGEQFSTVHDFSWNRIQKGMRDIEKRYPGSLINLNRFAWLACLMKDRAVAKEYFDQLGSWQEGRVNPGTWRNEQIYRQWHDWAFEFGPYPLGDALHRAARSGNLEALKELLRQGEDVNARTTSGSTPLIVACVNRRAEAALLLIDNKADIHVKAASARTPLFYAASAGLMPVVERLLKAGASPVTPDTDGWTAIHVAARFGHTEVLKLLLAQRGASPSTPLRSRHTPLHLAARGGHVETVAFLLERPDVEPNARAMSGETPLHVAAEYGSAGCVKVLLEHRADPQAEDDRNQRPLDLAIDRKHPAVAAILQPVTKGERKPPPAGRVSTSPS